MKDKESADNIPKGIIRIQTKWFIAIFALSSLILLPVFLKFVFSINIPSDWLAYYGTCLATLGTVFLGAVAVWQNYIINEKSRQFQEYARKQEIKANEPKLKCTQIEYANNSKVKNPTISDYLPLYIATIKNTTENDASNIHIEDSYLINKKKNIKEKLEPDIDIDYLQKYESTKLAFKLTLSLPKDCNLDFQIHYEDKYGGTHKQHVIAYPEGNIESEWNINNIT